jgi:hypothetical protein
MVLIFQTDAAPCACTVVALTEPWDPENLQQLHASATRGTFKFLDLSVFYHSLFDVHTYFR